MQPYSTNQLDCIIFGNKQFTVKLTIPFFRNKHLRYEQYATQMLTLPRSGATKHVSGNGTNKQRSIWICGASQMWRCCLRRQATDGVYRLPLRPMTRLVALLFVVPQGHWNVGWKYSVLGARGLVHTLTTVRGTHVLQSSVPVTGTGYSRGHHEMD